MKIKLLSIAAGAVVTACTAASAADGYKLTLPLNADDDDATVYLVDFDNGNKIDSAVVENATAVFTGRVETPVIARMVMEGRRLGNIVLENAQMTIAPDGTVDSPLNNTLQQLARRQQEIYRQYQALPDTPDRPAKAKALEASYVAVADSVFDANVDNAVGYYVFVNQAYDMSLDQLNDALAKYPRFRNSKRVANLLTAAENKERTAVGQKFVDFEIAADSTVQRLSDYVGKGRYVLVDFWASWCGPCIRETAVIKDIYKKYGPEGTGQLDVLGVAVWDEPQNTRSAIERHKLPWPQIINAQSVPTDLYGVSGIPAIFIFAPDGTIVSRGKQGDELRADIARLLDSAPAQQAD